MIWNQGDRIGRGVGVLGHFHGEQRVVDQVGRRTQWPAPVAHQPRCTHRHHGFLEQRLALAVARGAEPHRDIDLAAHQVQLLVGGRQANIHPGVAFGKTGPGAGSATGMQTRVWW